MDISKYGGENHTGRPERPIMQAMWRGFRGRCPHCDQGRLFRAFLKTVDRCEVCREDIHHHRADDLPAYLVIMIVGHVVVGGFMSAEMMFDLSLLQHLAIWVPITVLSSILLLQPVKGAMVGLQWALYMHGFGGEADTVDS